MSVPQMRVPRLTEGRALSSTAASLPHPAAAALMPAAMAIPIIHFLLLISIPRFYVYFTVDTMSHISGVSNPSFQQATPARSYSLIKSILSFMDSFSSIHISCSPLLFTALP